MQQRGGTNLLLGLLVWGVGLCALSGGLDASEPSAGDEAASGTVTKNVKHVVRGEDYKGVLEMSHHAIAYASEHTEWLESIPWNRVLGWKCFGSKHTDPNEEDLCTLWIHVEKGEAHAGAHLFFKVPCEMIPGQDNWETLESYDPRDRF